LERLEPTKVLQGSYLLAAIEEACSSDLTPWVTVLELKIKAYLIVQW